MDSQRLILFFVFSFSLFFLLDAWQRDQKPPTEVSTLGRVNNAPAPVSQVPTAPALPVEPAMTKPGAPQIGTRPAQPLAQSSGDVIIVETDTMRVEISRVGGDIRRLELLRHKGTLDKTKNFVLFQRESNRSYFAQSGLIGDGFPNHHSIYTSASREYRMVSGANGLEVRLEAPETAGLKAALIYKFTRGSYVIEVGYDVVNKGTSAIPLFAYYQLVRDRISPDGDSAMLPTYTGPAVFTKGDKFQKVAFDDIDNGKAPYSKSSQDEGWIGIIQHYFVSALLPQEKIAREFYTSKLDGGLYSAGVKVAAGMIPAGGNRMVDTRLYAGPQDSAILEKLAPGLDLVVDYGILTVIAVPLFIVLNWIHGWVGNWGIAIVLLTVLVKAIFYPLQEASYRAMAKMKVIAPKMQQLKERYGDDRQKLQKAMMELYQKEKVNPMAGCLPIVVQMPVFISLYWVILGSVGLRHAPFYGWITDLSVVDPWYVLPILMGASMIVQTRLNPVPPDPVQAKVMKIMPIAFSVFFFFFPAGLVLYWLVNNILSIAQQWHINLKIEKAAAKQTGKSAAVAKLEKK
jgi:YidC/Oxa1 family membrane protein insertase